MRWLVLALLFTARLALGYQFQSVASAAEQLIETFGFSYAQIGLLIGPFLLPGIVMAIPNVRARGRRTPPSALTPRVPPPSATGRGWPSGRAGR